MLLAQGHCRPDAAGPVAAAVTFNTQSGVRVVARQDANSNAVAISIFVRAGAAEDIRLPGIGSVVARGLFGRNQNQSVEQVDTYINAVGGSLDTTWNPDYTLITCLTSRSAFPDAFYLLCQAIKAAQFDRETLEKARAQVTSEIAHEVEDPFRAAYAALRARLYTTNPYRNPFGGTAASVRRITSADCQEFLARYYTPRNTVISVVGNISPDAVREAAENNLDNYSRPSRSSYVPEEPIPAESDRVVTELPVHTTTILAGFRGPGLMDADYPAFLVLTALIGGGKSSRLFRTVRDTDAIGYAVGAYTPSLTRDNALLAYVEYDPKRPGPDGKPVPKEVAERLLLDTVKSVIAKPPSDQELERARRYAAGSHALAHQRLRDRAFYLGWYELVGPGYAFDAELPHRIRTVTADDLQRVAGKYLKHWVVSIVQPEKESQ